MISKIPDNSDALLSRAQTAEALTEAGWRRVEPSRERDSYRLHERHVGFARPRLPAFRSERRSRGPSRARGRYWLSAASA
jgi:hypothetical protein